MEWTLHALGEYVKLLAKRNDVDEEMADVQEEIADVQEDVADAQADIETIKTDIGKIARGMKSAGTVNANSYKDVTIKHNLGVPCTVVATLYSSGTASNIGSICVAVAGRTTTEATIRIFNDRNTVINPSLEWIAIGI